MPAMPQLPTTRVTPSAPFTYIGLDYLGPLYIKHNLKVWICLYTCLAVRAIHLELLSDMSAEQFILGIRRFIARYGKPTMIISDNAQQFKLANSTLEKVWENVINDEQVTSYVANQNIKWNFIVQRAPWMGGFYERLVGLVKRSLRKSIGKTSLSWNQLFTIITEVQAVINNRPMVYVDDDINSGNILTPSHFLTMNPKTGLPEIEEGDDSEFITKLSSVEKLLETWKRGQNRLTQFWKSWQNEYLLSLRERYQDQLKHPRKMSPHTPSVGDTVLIKENLPRGSWKIAKIVRLYESKDGQIRAAQLMLPTHKLLQRPLNLLYPLECATVDDNANVLNDDSKSRDNQQITKTDDMLNNRPRRVAAVNATEKIKQQFENNET